MRVHEVPKSIVFVACSMSQQITMHGFFSFAKKTSNVALLIQFNEIERRIDLIHFRSFFPAGTIPAGKYSEMEIYMRTESSP